MKTYGIKFYTLAGAYISTLSPSFVMNAPSFSATTEGGQGELSIRLALPGNDTSVNYNTIARVLCYDQDNMSGRVIYSGYVTQIKRVFAETQYIDLRLVGLASMLSFVTYNTGTFTGDPGQLVRDVLDFFAIRYPGAVTYTPESIPLAGFSITVSLQYLSCFEAISAIAKSTKYFWTVSGEGVFNFKTADTYPLRILTMARDVESFEIEENTEQMANSVTVFGGYGLWGAQDLPSIAANGFRERTFSVPEIPDIPNATIRAQAELEKFRYAKKRIRAVVNNRFDLESLQAGDRIAIRNASLPIETLQIRRIEYNEKEARIDLDETRSFAREIATL